jgi:hypothetical protein
MVAQVFSAEHRDNLNREVIVSASYKTDIPAFYGEWFLNRVRAGYCKMINPYNRQVVCVPLTRDAVDGFVFWTKNLGPFLPALETVRELGYPFVVQYTINAYPRALEFSVTDAARSIQHMRWLRERFGAYAAVWRYDPIVFTSETDADFHARNFAALASELEGSTDEVVASFAQIYRKTERNMNAAAREFGFTWEDPGDDVKRQLASQLAEAARRRGMQLNLCAQPQYAVCGAGEARCISGSRLARLSGGPVESIRKGNRPDCACDGSRDIGDYDTCPHGCVYCYAVRSRALARRRYGQHDPRSEFLFETDDSNQVRWS